MSKLTQIDKRVKNLIVKISFIISVFVFGFFSSLFLKGELPIISVPVWAACLVVTVVSIINKFEEEFPYKEKEKEDA